MSESRRCPKALAHSLCAGAIDQSLNEKVAIKGSYGLWASPLDKREMGLALGVMLDVCVNARGRPNSVELRLLDNQSMAAINEVYLFCPGPTNIISFPQGSHKDYSFAGAKNILESMPGLLCLGMDFLWLESMLYGQGIEGRMLALLAHGMAHLAGHEHGEAMEELERACVAVGKMALRAERVLSMAGNGFKGEERG